MMSPLPRRSALLPILCLAGLVWTLPVRSDTAEALSRGIPLGQWRLDYQRKGVLKILPIPREEKGSSRVCIDKSPRLMITEWLESKGCRVDGEASRSERVQHFSGQCTLKWLKGTPIPVDVEITLADGLSFTLDIKARENPLMLFTEHTLATRTSPVCEPKMGRDKKNQTRTD